LTPSRHRSALLRSLCQAGLLHIVGPPEYPEAGYVVHDFNEHNPSREKVLRKREADKKRQQEWRESKKSHRDTSRRHGVNHASPTRPDPPLKGGGEAATPAQGEPSPPDWLSRARAIDGIGENEIKLLAELPAAKRDAAIELLERDPGSDMPDKVDNLCAAARAERKEVGKMLGDAAEKFRPKRGKAGRA
jgi:hypothetical protein